MGDVAMTVPVIKVLRDTYPKIKITILTKAFFKPLFKVINNVDIKIAEIEGEHKGVQGLYQLSKDLKSQDLTHIADLHNVLRSNILKTFLSFSRLKVATIDKGRSEKKQVIKSSKNKIRFLKTTCQRYAEVFNQLGFPIELNTYTYPKKLAVPSEINTNYLKGSERKWIGIAPFAHYQSKTYPFSLLTEVVAELDRKNEFDILLFGGGTKEIEQLRQLEKTFKNCTLISNKISFAEEIQVLSNVDVMVAMDSGNAHIAAIFKLPVITLWGVTHPGLGFAPFKQLLENCLLSDRNQYPLIPTSVYGNKVPKGYENAMQTIPPKTVINKILEVIKQK
ncbi:glycosyltransferase family 9 protein [Aquimarina sp. ERC-38]|uniref:glycosyltransferase family 9 protein n=1 Tax=Aquimarina sp. ERC-38 TaxID=2949996 RepID=UPI0022470A9E|nr:glycosyltransferase family 9 protein [Aquimarina sp. ERC-38]UZO81893.1 glycosyltransferase family 9 protein [Aquimarina sp. ERC-38]